MLLLALALFVIGQNVYVTAAITERISGISEDTSAAGGVNSVDYDVVVPEACKGRNYCLIKPNNSSQDDVNNFFEFEEIILHEPAWTDNILRRERMFGYGESIPLCSSEIRYQKMAVKKRYGTDDKWYLTTQAHYVEECLNPEASCNEKLEISDRWTTICKQKMRTFHVEVKTNKGKNKIISTSLPNGCSCEITDW